MEKKHCLVKGTPKPMTNNNEVCRSVNDREKTQFEQQPKGIESQLSIDNGLQISSKKKNEMGLFTWNEPFDSIKGMEYVIPDG